MALNTPQSPSFVIELGKAPPAGDTGQEAGEAVVLPAAQAAQAVAPPKALAVPSMAAPTPAPKSPVEQLPAVQTPVKPEQTRPSEPLAPTPTTNASQAEPAEPIVQGGAKSSSESMRTAEPDYKAAYLNNPRPPYPRNAHRFGIEGQVILQAEVNEQGMPSQIRVLQSSGNDLLDESALNTVAKWRFSPARKDGVMVRAVVKIPITFSLKSNHLK